MVFIWHDSQKVLVTSGESLFSYNLEDDEEKLIQFPDPVLPQNVTPGQLLLKDKHTITCLSVSKSSGNIVVATENKQVIVFNKEFAVLKNFVVNRITSKVCFTNEDDVIIADKTGYVYLYRLEENLNAPELLLGHLSVILNVVLSECGKYIITCDRDEKIRVSKYPNAYNIVSYCLGHKEFVTSIKIIRNILFSASGDGTIRLWNYVSGQQLGIINTNDNIKTKESLLNSFVHKMDKENIQISAVPITDMQIQCKGDKSFIATSLHTYNNIQIYMVDLNTYDTSFVKDIEVSNFFCFSLTCDLLILTTEHFIKYEFSNNNYVAADCNKVNKFYNRCKNSLQMSEDSSITLLYKRKIDNVQEYLERKKQRLELK